MNFHTPLLLALIAAIPVAGLAKPAKKSGKGLPPQFGGLIQPAPAGTADLRSGLISSELAGRDLEFLTNTIEQGRLQSWLVKQAQEKAETPEVKSIGGALVEIQEQENSFVAKLAASKGVAMPGPNTPPPAQKKIASQIGSLKGAKLEKALVEHILNAAEQSVTGYEAALRSQDPEIKRLAEQMLPAAKGRLQFAAKASGRAQETNVKPAFRTGTVAAPATDQAPPAPRTNANPPPRPPAPTPVPRGNTPPAIAAPPAPAAAPRAAGAPSASPAPQKK